MKIIVPGRDAGTLLFKVSKHFIISLLENKYCTETYSIKQIVSVLYP